MNCEYCYLRSKYHDGKHWEQEYGDCGCICNGDDGMTTHIAVWNKHEPTKSLMLIRGVKYCPFCGSRIMVADRLSEIAPHKEWEDAPEEPKSNIGDLPAFPPASLTKSKAEELLAEIEKAKNPLATYLKNIGGSEE